MKSKKSEKVEKSRKESNFDETFGKVFENIGTFAIRGKFIVS